MLHPLSPHIDLLSLPTRTMSFHWSRYRTTHLTHQISIFTNATCFVRHPLNAFFDLEEHEIFCRCFLSVRVQAGDSCDHMSHLTSRHVLFIDIQSYFATSFLGIYGSHLVYAWKAGSLRIPTWLTFPFWKYQTYTYTYAAGTSWSLHLKTQLTHARLIASHDTDLSNWNQKEKTPCIDLPTCCWQGGC